MKDSPQRPDRPNPCSVPCFPRARCIGCRGCWWRRAIWRAPPKRSNWHDVSANCWRRNVRVIRRRRRMIPPHKRTRPSQRPARAPHKRLSLSPHRLRTQTRRRVRTRIRQRAQARLIRPMQDRRHRNRVVSPLLRRRRTPRRHLHPLISPTLTVRMPGTPTWTGPQALLRRSAISLSMDRRPSPKP